jgi:hypothetical protein
MRNILFFAAATFALGGCIGGHGGNGGNDDSEGGTGDADDSGATTDDSGNNNGGNEAECTIRGTVTVQLYTYDDDGELEYVSFDDAYGGSFPFGAVWVTSYLADGNGGVAGYTGSETFHNPSADGDEFEITAKLNQAGEVRLFGELDYWNDRVLGSSEPMGIYPDAVDCTDGSEHNDVDITILAPYYDFDGNGGGGPGGGGDCNVSIDGDILITELYDGGEAAAMVLDANNGGPHYWTFTDPQVNGGGASSAYGLNVCDNFGTANLVGCWDDDGNLLFDPADTWGAYVSSPDTDGNPISIGTTNLSGYDVQIPLGDGSTPWGIVPFVTLSGEATLQGGVFDDLPSGSSVYVVALKYRPTADINVATLAADAYDMESFAWGDLTGQSSVNWDINVPASTIVYLWAYADTDGDGVVNEADEHVASGGINSTGKLPTGTASTSGITLGLSLAGQ